MPVCSRNSLYSESQAFGVTEVWHFNNSNFQSLWAIIKFSLGAGEKKMPRIEPKETKLCLESSWDPAWMLSCMLLLPCSNAEALVSGQGNPEPWLWGEVSKERCWKYMSSSLLDFVAIALGNHCHFSALSLSKCSPFPWQVSWFPALLKFGYVACWVQRLGLSTHSLNVDGNTEFLVSCLNRLNLNFNSKYLAVLFILGSWISEMKTLLNFTCV